eukprot:jgi/Undpi1/10991/HiC_scaffold_30.g13292.m1
MRRAAGVGRVGAWGAERAGRATRVGGARKGDSVVPSLEGRGGRDGLEGAGGKEKQGGGGKPEGGGRGKLGGGRDNRGSGGNEGKGEGMADVVAGGTGGGKKGGRGSDGYKERTRQRGGG